MLLHTRINLANETFLERGLKQFVVEKACQLRLTAKVVELGVLDNYLVDLVLIQEFRRINLSVEILFMLRPFPEDMQLARVRQRLVPLHVSGPVLNTDVESRDYVLVLDLFERLVLALFDQDLIGLPHGISLSIRVHLEAFADLPLSQLGQVAHNEEILTGRRLAPLQYKLNAYHRLYFQSSSR